MNFSIAMAGINLISQQVNPKTMNLDGANPDIAESVYFGDEVMQTLHRMIKSLRTLEIKTIELKEQQKKDPESRSLNSLIQESEKQKEQMSKNIEIYAGIESSNRETDLDIGIKIASA